MQEAPILKIEKEVSDKRAQNGDRSTGGQSSFGFGAVAFLLGLPSKAKALVSKVAFKKGGSGSSAKNIQKTNLGIQQSTPQAGENLKSKLPSGGRGTGIGFRVNKKIVVLILSLFFVLFLAIVAVKFLSNTPESTNGEISVGATPTPTSTPPIPDKPSVYFDDPLILEYEEKLKVLDNEVSTAQIRETKLTPPVLDFNVSFEN